MKIVEVGLELKEDLSYYDELLRKNGLINDFNCTTHDLYYANGDLNGDNEGLMKIRCIRLRSVNDSDFEVQNPKDMFLWDSVVKKEELKEYEKFLSIGNYSRIFDTTKKDHHYSKEGMKSKIQLQEIENIGLVLYYDNPEYYDMDYEEQRNKLIDDLNGLGFSFGYDELGLDKLRTLFYKQKMYSMNQAYMPGAHSHLK